MRKYRSLIALVVLLLGSNLVSAQVPETPSEPDQTPPDQTNTEQILADSEETLAEDGDASAQEESEDSSSRFIPTEQISQDLGVSFPADI